MLCIVVLPLLRESLLPDVMAGSIGYRFLQAVQSILLELKCSAVLDLGGIIMAKGFGVSPITNTIYYGTQDPVKHMWTGKKEDVTDGAIGAVYEWFMGNMKDDMEEYSITYPSTEFELVMRRKKK